MNIYTDDKEDAEITLTGFIKLVLAQKTSTLSNPL